MVRQLIGVRSRRPEGLNSAFLQAPSVQLSSDPQRLQPCGEERGSEFLHPLTLEF
jgi:hypothetical protein